MNRSKSRPAQVTFDLVHWLRRQLSAKGRSERTLARLGLRAAIPLARRFGVGRVVTASIYGHSMVMPAEHRLPEVLQDLPQYNRPLGLAVEAISKLQPRGSKLVIVDVGANIGDTAAIVEQRLPGVCYYLCIEPDPDLAALCRLNHRGNSRLQLVQCFIGEDEGELVQLEDNGRANPSTKRVDAAATETHDLGRLVRLDTVIAPFAKDHGGLSLIKVDTEGYDFSVLRSGSEMLAQYHPSVFLEWYPQLLLELNQTVWDGFDYLAGLGYKHFVFFTKQGDFYTKVSKPDRQFLRGLASVALDDESNCYFDVFATVSEAIRDQLIELGMSKQVTPG